MIDPRTRILTFLVEPAKLSDYLLNLENADGASKAARFLRHNFTPDLLREALVGQGRTGRLERAKPTPWGINLEIVDPISTPLNTYIDLRTVWEIRPTDPTTARLVTAVFVG